MKFAFSLAAITLAAGLVSAADTKQLTVSELAVVKGDDGKTYRIEDLGNPMTGKSSDVEFVSTGPKGEKIAWTVLTTPSRHGVLGINAETGETHWIDTTADFGPHAHRSELAPHGNDTIYVFSGDRFRIYKYTISTRTLKRLHVFPPGLGRFWMASRAVGPDGKIYVGTYPRNIAIGVDPATDKAFSLEPLTTEKNQQYLTAPAVDDDNVMYAPVGRRVPQLFSVKLPDGARKQLLTEELTKQLLKENVYIPTVYFYRGKVYTTIAGQRYLCTPDALQAVDNASIPWPDYVERVRANGRFPDRRISDSESAARFDDRGLVIAGKKGTRIVTVKFDAVEHEIYRFGTVRGNILYGSGIFPAKTFAIDLGTLIATDYGRCSSGGVQSYDFLDTPKGLLVSSYTGATLDFFEPGKPKGKGNPRQLAELEKTDQQERMPRLTKLNDRFVYSGSTPIKGYLGGAVVKIDLEREEVKVFRNILPDQSISDLLLCPDGKTLFGNGSILGGTGAKPKLKAADIFLYDTDTDKIVWTGKVFEEAISYMESGLTADGKIISFGRGSSNPEDKFYYYFIFDPVTREVLRKGSIPATFKRYLVSHPVPMGPEKLNYFSADGVLYAYDPAKKAVRKVLSHPSFDLTQDLFVTPDGYLWYLDKNVRLTRIKMF